MRVQIREDLALDSSPLSGMSRRLAPLNPSNTPYRTIKQPTKVNPLFSVEPASVVFETTAINRFQGEFHSNSSNLYSNAFEL